MSDEEFQRAQDAGLPKEDLSPYVGKWVALRDGYVVAADLNPTALRDQSQVLPDDLLLLVPSREPLWLL